MNPAVLKRIVGAATIIFSLLPLPSAARAAELSALAAAVESIRTDDVRAHTDTLADDAFEGREAGTRGGQAAATYVMKKLEGYGLAPAGESGSYFQQFRSYRNVLAKLVGSDERLKDEVIVIGAHFDHVGYGSSKNSRRPGYIHNGADDNASGAAALLEVAEALSKLPEPPRRTILLAFWDAEEKGLLGSKHWVAHPTVPLEHVKLNINADMVGRLSDNKVIVYGTRTGPGLRRIVSTQNTATDFRLSFVWSIYSRSDHYSFVQKKIPVLMLHTGSHKDYHQPSDDADKLNVEGIQQVARLMMQVAIDLANCDDVPAFRSEGEWESGSHRRRYEAPSAPSPPRLGVSWETEQTADQTGVTLKQVTPGSAAFAAGLRAGDRILKFDGHETISGDALRQRVLAAENSVEIVVARPGAAAPLTLTAKLPGTPKRLGISWRENDAEPNAVTVVSVAAQSPADLAGVKRLDRVYAINGQEFAGSDDFQQRIAAAEGEIKLLVERDGRLLMAKIPPLR